MLQSHVLFLSLVLLSCLCLVLNDILDDDDCASLVEEIGTCWLDYPDVPICRGRDDLEKCATNGLSRARSCKDLITKEIQQMSRVYASMTSALCQNEELKRGFERKRTCWVMARNCALPLALFSVDNATKERCKEAMRGIVICGYHNFMCQELQQNYTRAVLSRSSCHRFQDAAALDDFAQHLHASSAPAGRPGSSNDVPVVVWTVGLALALLAANC